MTDQTQSDAILGGRVRLLQSVRGYRAGMDAALLAAAKVGTQLGPLLVLQRLVLRHPEDAELLATLGLAENAHALACLCRRIHVQQRQRRCGCEFADSADETQDRRDEPVVGRHKKNWLHSQW
jgi:hypothetical protein